MRRWACVVLVILGGAASMWAQSALPLGCWAAPDSEPTLVANPLSTVTFQCKNATRLELIRAVGRQARIPIGIAMGQDVGILEKTKQTYDLNNVDAKTALHEAIAGTGYSLEEKDGVIVLMAGDMTPYQRELLTYRLKDFGGGSGSILADWNFRLNMWLDAEIDPKSGYLGSLLFSPDDEVFPIETIHSATVEEIANKIVSQGSRGMWIFNAEAVATKGSPGQRIAIESYQRYSNRPLKN
jgi:hypothetical protein